MSIWLERELDPDFKRRREAEQTRLTVLTLYYFINNPGPVDFHDLVQVIGSGIRERQEALDPGVYEHERGLSGMMRLVASSLINQGAIDWRDGRELAAGENLEKVVGELVTLS